MAEDEDVDYEAWDDDDELVLEPEGDLASQPALTDTAEAKQPQAGESKEPDKPPAVAAAAPTQPSTDRGPGHDASAQAAQPKSILPDTPPGASGSEPSSLPSQVAVSVSTAQPATSQAPAADTNGKPAGQQHIKRAPVFAPQNRKQIPAPSKKQQQQQQQQGKGRGQAQQRQQGDGMGRGMGARLPAGNFQMARPQFPGRGDVQMMQMAARMGAHVPHMGRGGMGLQGAQIPQPRPVLPMPPNMLSHLAMAKAALSTSEAPREHDQRSRGPAHSGHSGQYDSSSRERRGDAGWSPNPNFSAPELVGPSLSGDFDDPDDPFAKKTTNKAPPVLPARTGRTAGSAGLSLAHGMDAAPAGRGHPGSSRPSSRNADSQPSGRGIVSNAPGPSLPPGMPGMLAMPPMLPGASGQLPTKLKRLADMPPLGSGGPSYTQTQLQTSRAMELQQQEQALQAAMAAQKEKIDKAEKKDALEAAIKAKMAEIIKLQERQLAAKKAADAKAAADKAAADQAAAEQAKAAADAAAAEEKAKAKAAQQAASKRARSETKDDRANGLRPATSKDTSGSRSSRSKRAKQDAGGKGGADGHPASDAAVADVAMDEWGPKNDAKAWEEDAAAAELPTGVDLRTLLTRNRSVRPSGDEGKETKGRRPKYQQPYKPPSRGSDR